MDIAILERAAMSVRIVFRGPVIAEHAEAAGTAQEQTFADLTSMTDWVAVHIPETERSMIRLWIDGTPVTGATLEATLRPIPEPETVDGFESA
jgi:hypothetical protein